jgi:dTDP-4-dehydrorhamnose reductase
MRVLLFGADGQVGTELRRRAGKAGAELVSLSRADCDLADAASVSAAIANAPVNAVVNAAAYTAVDKAEGEEALARAINARAPRAMAEACAKRGVALLHFSTDYVFDGDSPRPYVETDRTAPLGVYGRSKREGEEAIIESGADHAILRLSWVFSAHGANFVKTMLRIGREKGAARVVDDQRGRPTFAGDAADAAYLIVRALIADPAKAGVYHFAGAETVTWADFADKIFRGAGLAVDVTRIPTSAYPTPAKRPKYSVFDTTKFQKTFGVPAPSWGPGLRSVLDELEKAGKANP